MPSPSPTDLTYAAIDLGSNHFHLLIARARAGARDLLILDHLREHVSLAAGLDAEGGLRPETRQLALDCLTRFAQRLRIARPDRVLAVGTHTLRHLPDQAAFLVAATEALGHPIDIVDGQEEARLVYLGVSHGLAPQPEKRLVIDIGGGGTQLILGEGMRLHRADSLPMGALSWSRRFFAGGQLSLEALERAITAARLELGPYKRDYRALGHVRCEGASGTLRALLSVLSHNGWPAHEINREGVAWLVAQLQQTQSLDALTLAGLAPQRRAVLPGGVAILQALFDALKIDHLQISRAALRDGLIYDLVSREQDYDIREVGVEALRERFHASAAQADRVEKIALALFEQVAADWALTEQDADALLVASQLHEVGKAVSFDHYARHSAYIVGHAHLPGFTQGEQAVIAALLHNQHRHFHTEPLEALPAQRQEAAQRLTVLLRLAIALTRTRSPEERPELRVQVMGPQRLRLSLPQSWLEARPLSGADLLREQGLLAAAGIELECTTTAQ